MSNIVLVSKSGLYVKKYDGDRKSTRIDNLIPYLNDIIEFDKDITFKDFFKHIIYKCDLYSSIFASHLGHYNLNLFVDEWNKKCNRKKSSLNIEYLRIHWLGLEVDKIFSGGKICSGFDGYGKYADDSGKMMDTAFAIEYTPINELKNLKIKLDTKFSVYREYNELAHTFVPFTVYDVIGAILYEITWSGDPTNRQKEFDSLFKSACECKKLIDAGDMSKFKTFDEVFSTSKEKLKKLQKS